MAVKIKSLTIGEGRPKICVPITAENEEKLEIELQEIRKECFTSEGICVDMLEWRADFFDGIEEQQQRKKAAARIHQRFPELPVLFTLRTKREGGKGELSCETYKKLCEEVLEEGIAELLDVELSLEKQALEQLLKKAKSLSVSVVLSSHDFEKTPSKEEMKEKLLFMDELGADILKLAVMPKTAEDVLALLEVTREMKELTTKPVITMSMGKLGLISRLSGSVFGSAVTFAMAGKASAPGQIKAEKVRQILELF